MREQDLLWSKLEKSGQRFIKSSILEEFQKDPERHDNFSFRLDNLFVDLSKNRIGYGKGFYDKYLRKHIQINKNIVTIGVAFSFQKYHKLPIKKKDFK